MGLPDSNGDAPVLPQQGGRPRLDGRRACRHRHGTRPEPRARAALRHAAVRERPRAADSSGSPVLDFRQPGEGLLGWGPRDAQLGDQLWVLPGCHVPVVLRPNGNE
ncbi:hypothetical protein Micbo1qcDRAFT_129305 [Microdochium bolleyi]|uniref:Uncharacterized protein n=1 Tax=Microdochium bolleyi TaxID=196109 RepID=A0A136II99_9PEZI|nr:hypothetical protein Micbo1qcDRAFT_129305 [Microdochium bolleyi]